MSIQEHLNKIRNAIYGREVRESIAKGIETAYDDASEKDNANMEVKIARGTHPNLRSRLEEVDNKQQQTTAQLAHKINRGNVLSSDLSQEVKEQLTGGSVAVVGRNAIDKENVKHLSIPVEKLGFTTRTENLFDGNFIDGWTASTANGTITDSNESAKGLVIPIQVGTEYYARKLTSSDRFRGITFEEFPSVGADFKRVTFESASPIASGFFTAREGENFLYVQVSATREEPNINITTRRTTPKHIPYRKVSNEYIEHNKEREMAIYTNQYHVGDWTHSTLIPDTGELSPESVENRIVSKTFIVGRGSTIQSANDMGVYLYDIETKEYLERFSWITEYTADKDYWVRLILRERDNSDIIDPDGYNNKVKVTIGSSSEPYLSGNFTQFHKTKDYFNDNVGHRIGSSDNNDVYSEWDSFVSAHPNIVEKNLLGYGSNVDGSGDESLPIYEYVIDTSKNRPAGISEAPTFLIITGVHGYEKNTVWSTIHYFDQLLNDWHDNDTLASVRSNIRFKVIPLANPGGYNNNSRTNPNGVDINRNFPHFWNNVSSGEGTNVYKGVAPYSELEAKIIRDWLIENDDAMAFIDFHAYGHGEITPEDVTTISYMSTNAPKPKNVYNSLIKRLSGIWERDYFNKEESNVYGWSSNSIVSSTVNEAFFVREIEYSATIEMADQFNGPYTKELVEMGADLLANYISSSIDYLINS